MNFVLDKIVYSSKMFSHEQTHGAERVHQERSGHYRASSRMRGRSPGSGVHGKAALGRLSGLPKLRLFQRLQDDGLQRPVQAASELPLALPGEGRSEERRVGKECRSRWS